jgi:hypothetical protein
LICITAKDHAGGDYLFMDPDDDVRQCVAAMIRRHGGQAADVAEQLAAAHFALDADEVGRFWAVLAALIREEIGTIS